MTERKTHLDPLAIGLLLLCCALWGLNQVATKLTLASVPPLTQAALRSLGAAVLVALWARHRGILLGVGNGTLKGGVLAGLLFALEFGCIFVGLQYTSASRMIVFIYLAPFVVALGMPLVAKSERPDAVQLIGLGAAFAGVAWAFAEGWQSPTVGDRQWLGDALGVAAALLWGGTTLVIRGSRLTTASPEQTLLYQLAISGVALGAAAWVAGEAWPVQWGAGALALLGYQTVIVCFASYLLWFWLIRHYPATRLAAFTLLTPLFGLLAGVGLLHEPLTARLLIACAAVAVGIALVNRPAR
ncbi:DMT family transporter [Aquincola sp. S2]|uniref:DMT family transporter n=1 Tax=Pseudaquabacterium terrae TaxID=2732868 RepID=A0ABX2EDG0_9BURK|nr:DMT family transporter [Aquabacterium terrae]NRF66238.1 DMT family transporter [Aquabacterium terrae]